jgi:2-polyprenyl-6-methoxyphenol hydroxylase-like FAD-dependent oxidoreductase
MNLPSTTKFYHAVIAGAGPVGLMLACCLRACGLSFLFLERREDRRSHGRVVALHPPSLELLDRLSLLEPVLAAGRRVTQGRVVAGARSVDAASFADWPAPYNYVLTLPQADVERILEARVEQLLPGSIYRDSVVESFQNGAASVKVRARIGVRTLELNAGFLVGSDGPRSMVRTSQGIELEQGSEGDAFAMGDFDDVGGFGDEAIIFADGRGFIESLPLPGRHRRWVLQTPGLVKNPDESSFVAAIRERTGVDLARHRAGLLIGTTVSRYVAASFHKGRAALVGDAAHALTPLSGRGLNGGLMDARDLAGAIHHSSQAQASPDVELREYTLRGRARALEDDRWAAESFAGGRGVGEPWLRSMGRRLGLHLPGRNAAAEFFSVCGS